jgi:type IV secretion system protein VirB6
MNTPVTIVTFGQLFDKALDQYVVNAESILMGWLSPIAVTLVTLWVLMYGYATVRNETGDSVATFAGKALKISLILAVALTANVYQSWVVGNANSLLNSLSSLFLQAGGLVGVASTSWSVIDQYDSQVETVVATLGKDVVQITPPFMNFPNLFAIVLISLGGCFFEVCVLAVTCFAKIMLTLTLSLGPIFILTLMFTATSKFFDAWLSKLLAAVMLSGVTFFLAGLSLSITARFLAGFLGQISTINFIAAGMVVGVIELLLGVVMIQAPTLAAALTGGAVFQSGVGTVSALIAGRGIGARTHAALPPPTGGVVHAGGAGSYFTAAGIGRGAAAAGGAVRRAAYKLAAFRSRT